MTWRPSRVEPGGAAVATCDVCDVVLWTPGTVASSPACEPHRGTCWAADPLQVEVGGLPLWSVIVPVWRDGGQERVGVREAREAVAAASPDALGRPWMVDVVRRLR